LSTQLGRAQDLDIRRKGKGWEGEHLTNILLKGTLYPTLDEVRTQKLKIEIGAWAKAQRLKKRGIHTLSFVGGMPELRPLSPF